MINGIIHNLERITLILNDIPQNIQKERTVLLTSLNDLFEDLQDQFAGQTEALKKISAFKKDALKEIDGFCDVICKGVKEDVRIVEE